MLPISCLPTPVLLTLDSWLTAIEEWQTWEELSSPLTQHSHFIILPCLPCWYSWAAWIFVVGNSRSVFPHRPYTYAHSIATLQLSGSVFCSQRGDTCQVAASACFIHMYKTEQSSNFSQVILFILAYGSPDSPALFLFAFLSDRVKMDP